MSNINDKLAIQKMKLENKNYSITRKQLAELLERIDEKIPEGIVEAIEYETNLINNDSDFCLYCLGKGTRKGNNEVDTLKKMREQRSKERDSGGHIQFTQFNVKSYLNSVIKSMDNIIQQRGKDVPEFYYKKAFETVKESIFGENDKS